MPQDLSPEYNAAYEEGKIAFSNGQSIFENPYGEQHPKYQGWVDGWCDANEEDNKYKSGR